MGAYVSSPKTVRYEQRLKELQAITVEEIIQRADLSWLNVTDKIFTPVDQDDDMRVRILTKMHCPDYEPPTHVLELLTHVVVLLVYFSGLSNKDTEIGYEIMNFTFAKIVWKSCAIIELCDGRGKSLDVSKSASSAKSRKSLASRQMVLETYYQLRGDKYKTDNHVYKEIQRKLTKKVSLATIRRYLLTDELITNQLPSRVKKFKN